MDTEQPKAEDQQTDESVEDFKEEVENDPSTASPPSEDPTDSERLRGG